MVIWYIFPVLVCFTGNPVFRCKSRFPPFSISPFCSSSSVTRDRSYNDNFWRLFAHFRRKNGVFLKKKQCYDHIFAKTSSSLSKNTPIFSAKKMVEIIYKSLHRSQIGRHFLVLGAILYCSMVRTHFFTK
jgi:hypothetical protein